MDMVSFSKGSRGSWISGFLVSWFLLDFRFSGFLVSLVSGSSGVLVFLWFSWSRSTGAGVPKKIGGRRFLSPIPIRHP